MVVTLTTAAKNWLAQNAGVDNCFSPTGVSYTDAQGVPHISSTGEVVNAFFVAHMVGADTANIIANTNYNGFKAINANTDLGFDDVDFAYNNDGTTSGIPAYCYVSPADIVAIAITPAVMTCVEPCNTTVDITWKNNGGTTGNFIPTMIINGTSVPASSEALDAGVSVTKTFTLTGLLAGNHEICATPNTLPCVTIAVTAPVSSAYFTSTPPGAMIYIDNSETVSGITPFTVTDLSIGTHTYVLTNAECYSEVTGEFTTVIGSTVDVSATFDTAARFESAPSGARIWIDGIDKGVNTPQNITGLTVGEHTYILKKSGYMDTPGTFTTVLCQRVNVSADISQLQEAGMGGILIAGLAIGTILMSGNNKINNKKGSSKV